MKSPPSRGLLLPLLLLSLTGASAQEEQAQPIVDVLREEAAKLESFVESPLARRFLEAAALLPAAPVRVVLRDPDNRRQFYSEASAAELSTGERQRLEQVELGRETYYTTRYGSPLAYCRALDVAGEHGMRSFKNKHVLDYGYGTVGHLRLMALSGAEAVGVDVDSFLTALYSEAEDQGPLGKRGGSVRLVDGFWPGTPAVRDAVGAGYDLFLSKNTLKRGYVHPEREADPRRLLQLGVDDAEYVAAMFDVLKPGGLAVIYNLSPMQAPPDEPYIPWADGRCPFAPEIVVDAGFEIVRFDVDDSRAARTMARLLGWDEGGMDVDGNLFGHYTVLRKPKKRSR
jgi:hypothetical protein